MTLADCSLSLGAAADDGLSFAIHFIDLASILAVVWKLALIA